MLSRSTLLPTVDSRMLALVIGVISKASTPDCSLIIENRMIRALGSAIRMEI